ncbi:MAG: DUF2059 domain-containing protein [Candidatus Omnitrophica bacterium]|nr:DUF2059 domain-containing protein [Candidatus Omnitrophota bacterium]
MKKLWIFLCVMLLSSVVFAETINFKNGHSMTGKILEKNAQSIKIDLNGVAVTYYADEIKDIDGQPMAPEPAAASTLEPMPLPAPTPTPASVPVSLVNPTFLATDDPAEKKVLILKFIDVFGTRLSLTRNFEGMLNLLSKQKPEEVQKIRDRVKVDEIIERLIPLYDKHFTAEELKTYIDFYSSDKGQKLISSIGAIVKESIQVSADYFKEKFPEMGKKQ